MRDTKFILGWEIKYTIKGIELFQDSYKQKVIEKFGYSNSCSITISLERKLLKKREPGIGVENITEY
jgi:hypothetical protein